MALKGKTVAVIGAGIAGLAAALALARKGAEVTVFEQAAELNEVGAGLQISANGIRVLQAFGLDPLTGNAGNMPSGVEIRDFATDRKTVAVALNRAASEPYIQYHRADLLNLLADACYSAGVDIRLNAQASVNNCHQGTVVFGGNSRSSAEFDVVVGADGVRSRARRTHLAGDDPVFSGQVAWRALIPAADLPSRAAVSGTRLYLGPNRHLVIYPLRDRSVINIVAVEERSEWVAEGWNHFDDAKNLRAAYDGWCPFVADLLNVVEQPLLWGLFAHPVLPRWSSGRLTLVGDAAHPMLPFMAQGACMGLEDAWELAEVLCAEPDTKTALKSYETRRKPRATRVQEVSRGNAGIYHAANPLKRAGLHLGMGLASRLAPQMLSKRYDWIYDYDVTKES
ncbi:MAG: FAD-dependent oxidoreductase [Rhodobacteraceae bacterium]|nr:FAD-dependent oxidoreductase [Paracoccaceae bacterium]